MYVSYVALLLSDTCMFKEVYSLRAKYLSNSSAFQVIWADQQIVKRRVRRDYNPHYNDPDFSKQWFLVSMKMLVM